MAVYVQPYNPWREQLAVSVLGPLLSGLIQQSQTNDRNRKLNAFGNEVQNRVNQLSTSPTLDEVELHRMFDTDETLAKYTTPASPWASGLGQNASTNPWMTNGPSISPNWDIAQLGSLFSGPARGATTQDAQRIATELLATPRFNMLDHTAAQGAIAPMLAGLEAQAQAQAAAQQQAQKQAQIADFVTRYRGAQTPQERNALGLEMSLNGLSAEALKHLIPHYGFNQVNAGDSVFEVNRDPVTGAVNPAFEAKVGLAPDTRYTVDERRENNQGKLALGYSELEEKQRHNVESENQAANRLAFDEANKRWERENPDWTVHTADAGDYLYSYAFNKKTQETKYLYEWKKGKDPNKNPSTAGQFTERDRINNEIRSIDNEIKAIDQEIRANSVDVNLNSARGERARQREAELKQQKAKLQKRRQELNAGGQVTQPAPTAPVSADVVSPAMAAGQGAEALYQSLPTSGDMAPVPSGDVEAEAMGEESSVFPPEMIYDPVRDADIDQQLIMPEMEARRMLDYADAGKYMSHLGINNRQEMRDLMAKTGYKIKMEGTNG